VHDFFLFKILTNYDPLLYVGDLHNEFKLKINASLFHEEIRSRTSRRVKLVPYRNIQLVYHAVGYSEFEYSFAGWPVTNIEKTKFSPAALALLKATLSWSGDANPVEEIIICETRTAILEPNGVLAKWCEFEKVHGRGYQNAVRTKAGDLPLIYKATVTFKRSIHKKTRRVRQVVTLIFCTCTVNASTVLRWPQTENLNQPGCLDPETRDKIRSWAWMLDKKAALFIAEITPKRGCPQLVDQQETQAQEEEEIPEEEQEEEANYVPLKQHLLYGNGADSDPD